MSRINSILIPIFFFIHYLGIGALAQGIIIILLIIEILRGKRIHFSNVDIFLIVSSLLLFIIKSINSGLIINILIYKFYWGFIIFYFYFKISNFKFDYLLFFWLTVIITVIEIILINTIVPLELMKNVPSAHLNYISSDFEFIFYNRTYGLASIPAASATILIVLLASLYSLQYKDFRNYHIFVTSGVLLCFGSASGFLIFSYFLYMRFKLYKGFKFNLGIIFFALLIYFMSTQSINEATLFRRLSLEYFNNLFEYKSLQITEVLNKLNYSSFEYLFGVDYSDEMDIRLLSDFGWIDMLECYGFLGITIFMLYIMFMKKLFFLPITIFILGYFHYPALGSIPGQILFASLLLSKNSYENITSKVQNKNLNNELSQELI